MARMDEGAYSENFRPDRETGGVHNLPWTQEVKSVVADVTNWELFSEEGEKDQYGSKGTGDLTGVGFENYPEGHDEQSDLGSGAGPTD